MLDIVNVKELMRRIRLKNRVKLVKKRLRR
jgi:hypothetical protein